MPSDAEKVYDGWSGARDLGWAIVRALPGWEERGKQERKRTKRFKNLHKLSRKSSQVLTRCKPSLERDKEGGEEDESGRRASRVG